MSNGLSAGVYPKILDESGGAQTPSTNTTGIIMIAPTNVFSKKPVYITGGAKELVEIYGKAQYGFDNYVASKLICDSTSCWVVNIPHTTSNSDKKATIDLTSGPEESTPLVKVEYVVPGEEGNDISVTVTESSEGKFSFTVSNKEGDPLEKFKDVDFNKFSLSYVDNVYSQFVKLTALEGAKENSTVEAKKYQLTGGTLQKISYEKGDVVAAINELKNQELYDLSMIVAPCMSHEAEILTALNTACKENGTMRSIVAPPLAVTKASDVVSWSNGTLDGETNPKNSINNSQISVYAPWGKVFDEDINSSVWISPECEVIAARVFTNDNFQPWFANAGTTRGKVKRFTELAALYNEGDRDLLYGGTNIVNPIAKIGSFGFLIYGQKTSLRDTTKQLTRENVRVLQNYIQKQVMTASQEYVFEQNDQYTWDTWIAMATGVMSLIKRARGVYDYKVTMAPTDEEIDKFEMPGLIQYKPTKTAEFIPITFNLKAKSSAM